MRKPAYCAPVLALVVSLLVAGCTAQTEEPAPEEAKATIADGAAERQIIATETASELSVETLETYFSSAPKVLMLGAEAEPEELIEAGSFALSHGIPVLQLGEEAVPEDGLSALDTEQLLLDVSVSESERSRLEELANVSVQDREPEGDATETQDEPADQTGDVTTAGSDPLKALAEMESGEHHNPEWVVSVHADPAVLSAAINARVAGADLHISEAEDPRADRNLLAVTAETEHLSALVLTDEVSDFNWQFETASTGEQLPGGGQLVFDQKRYVVLYGSPITPALGLLGEQGTDATIARAEEYAAKYDDLFGQDASIPALEIIVTVAASSPGAGGNYTNEWDPEEFVPLIEAAEEAGQYVVIDFQPGRASFPEQIKRYEQLLAYPNVGVALDPEWRIGPNERHLARIGHVEASEVNEVIDYVADYTRENRLPQKMVVLHQFQTQMLRDRDQIDTTRSEVAVLIHADGQGTQGEKDATWNNLQNGAPEGITWGWKNFIDEDHPMLTPEQTVEVNPLPHFISYQ